MNDDFTYVIERFTSSGDEEVLLQRAELIRKDDAFICLLQGREERLIEAKDAPAAIAAEPILSEIPANQVTRITASGNTYEELPFILRVPGDRDDFDEGLWSETLAEEHTSERWVVQPGRFRVAYINGDRWSPFPTPDGPRMLPEAWPTVALSPTWGHLTFAEHASMVSGVDEMFVGLVTEHVVAACYYPDCTVDGSERDVTLWRRGADGSDDAKLFVEWLLDWIPRTWCNEPEMLAQLFVDAALNGFDGEPVSGSRLVAGLSLIPFLGGNDTSEWNLELGLSDSDVFDALDLIAQHSPKFAEIVQAGRDPSSAPGLKRHAELGDLDAGLTGGAGDSDEGDTDDDEEDEDYDDEDDDSDGRWNVPAVASLPKVIEPGEFTIRLWHRYVGLKKPVAFDFVFLWSGGRSVEWRYAQSPDGDPIGIAPFDGTAIWPNGVDVQVTYSCTRRAISGEVALKGAAPMVMDPHSDERMKRPAVWVELANKIAYSLDRLDVER